MREHCTANREHHLASAKRSNRQQQMWLREIENMPRAD